ncbi:MAG: sugar ABC transporter permease [Spirochaetales bacterium]|nr:sugar ABC transporter permease [Spirochaetales bacterium]
MKTKLTKSNLRDARTGYIFILPFVVLFAVFKVYPLIYGFAVSFLGRNSIRTVSDTTFVGLENYVKVLQSNSFWTSLEKSFQYALIYTVVVMVGGFLTAMLLNRKFRGRTFVRTMAYLPYVTNVIAIGIVLKYLFNPTKGPINAIFRAFGEAGPKWFSSPDLALPMTAIIGAWLAMAFNTITILAALQDIPNDLFEVADIEGASGLQRIRYIVLPMISSALFMLLTITVINSFKSYTTVVSLTNGGPASSSRVLSLQIYEDAFTYMKFSIAAAEGTLFTLIIITFNKILDKVRAVWENR